MPPTAPGFQVRIIRDDFTPWSERITDVLTKTRPILQAIGLEVVSITQQAFVDESLRAAPWAPKRDGSPATLIQSGVLRQSIRITSMNDTQVTVGTDRIYAAVQQLGGTIRPKPGKRALVFQSGGVKVFAKKVTIPARPYFPITSAGFMTATAQDRVAKVLRAAIAAYLPA